jgi:hypothetical protein
MKKIPIKQIPSELKKWIGKDSDLRLFRFTRSIGYTFEEIVKLAETNKNIKDIIPFISESVFEKVVHKVAEGSITYELAAFIVNTYKNSINNLSDNKTRMIEVNLGMPDETGEFQVQKSVQYEVDSKVFDKINKNR